MDVEIDVFCLFVCLLESNATSAGCFGIVFVGSDQSIHTSRIIGHRASQGERLVATTLRRVSLSLYEHYCNFCSKYYSVSNLCMFQGFIFLQVSHTVCAQPARSSSTLL